MRTEDRRVPKEQNVASIDQCEDVRDGRLVGRRWLAAARLGAVVLLCAAWSAGCSGLPPKVSPARAEKMRELWLAKRPAAYEICVYSLAQLSGVEQAPSIVDIVVRESKPVRVTYLESDCRLTEQDELAAEVAKTYTAEALLDLVVRLAHETVPGDGEVRATFDNELGYVRELVTRRPHGRGGMYRTGSVRVVFLHELPG
jgi:hypothetical protein